MNEALLISNLLLWAAVLALGAIVLALVRQVGVLHERVRPVGALVTREGPQVGDPAPQLGLADLHGREVRLGGAAAGGEDTLLFFLSPTCPVCESLLPTLRRVAAEQRPAARLVLASDGDPTEHLAYARAHDLEALPYVLSAALGITYQVAKLPYAVLIDGEGILRAKGLVNTREHVESLFEARRLGVASMQEYLQRHDDRRRAAGGGV